MADIVRHPLVFIGIPSKTGTCDECGRPLGIPEFLDIAHGESVGYIGIVILAFHNRRPDLNCIVDDGKTVPGLQEAKIEGHFQQAKGEPAVFPGVETNVEGREIKPPAIRINAFPCTKEIVVGEVGVYERRQKIVLPALNLVIPVFQDL